MPQTPTDAGESAGTTSNTGDPLDAAHASWCRRERIELTRYEVEQLVTHHCIDCGAHVAVTFGGTPLPPPTATGPFVGRDNHWSDNITMRRTNA